MKDTNNKPVKIVGFQSGHDVSYAILEDGIPIIHEELERFTREKEPFGDGLNMFFQRNPDMDDVDYFTFGNPASREMQPYRDKCYNEHDQIKMESIMKDQ